MTSARSLGAFSDADLNSALCQGENKGATKLQRIEDELRRRQREREAKASLARAASVFRQARVTRADNGKLSHRISLARVQRLLARHGDWDDNMLATVSCGFIQLGMTPEQVRESFGPPEAVNKSVGRWGVHEQWVYNSPYGPFVYFENGVLTSWQN